MRGITLKTRLFCVVASLAMTLGSSAASAQEPPSATIVRGQQLAEALRGGGYVVYLRHASTSADQVDADKPDFARCETQRNLSADGRRMARDIGGAFKALGIRVDKVITSPFCRTVETAQLAFGKHEATPVLYFAVGIEKDERTRQSQKLRQMLSTPPAANTNTVIVGHNANLKEAAGVWPKKEGDAHVFRPGAGGFVYVGDVTAEEWTRLAGAAAAR
jgi:phosphohistidine phosphatase SixA